MFTCGTIGILLIAGFICAGSANETRTLPNANILGTLAQSFLQQSAGLSSVSNGDFLQQLPLQLLSLPQVGDLVALLYNVSQTFNYSQLGQQRIGGDDAKPDPVRQRVLRPSNPSSPNNIFTTLPFNDLNLTEFSWLGDNLRANSDMKNQEGKRPHQKLFGGAGGGNNTIFADLNFVPVPQLLSLIGR